MLGIFEVATQETGTQLNFLICSRVGVHTHTSHGQYGAAQPANMHLSDLDGAVYVQILWYVQINNLILQ